MLLGPCSVRSLVGWCGLVVCLAAGSLVAGSPAAGVAGYGDVADDEYFTKPVQWSVDNDIAGIDGDCFLPDAPVSRGEAAVYIWNMEGQPSAPSHSFVDVTNENQNTAVSWMSQNQITTGTTPTTFEPDAALTRAHLVTFLHRLIGKPEAPAHSFVDVHASWQQNSVSWASHTGITTGTSPTTFEPDTTLTRAHFVTFLWRYKGKPDVTVDPDTPSCFTAVSAGQWHSCGVLGNGTIKCWGDDTERRTFAPSGEFTTVSAGSTYSCAVRTNGTIECWGGNNSSGQTDPPSGEFVTVSSGGAHSCGVRTNGRIECWGWNDNKQADAPSGEFTAVSAGYWHSCGVRTNGTIECWGSYGLTDAPAGQFNAVSTAQQYSCGLRTNNTIECWGWNDNKRANAPSGEFTAVSAGDWYPCGVRTNRTIECWGYSSEQLELAPPFGNEFTSVSVGGTFSCARRIDGTIECWGNNEFGQTDVPSIDVIQAVYVVPSDKTPSEGQDAAIAHAIDEVQSWFDTQTGGTHPVFSRDQDSISVATVNLSGTLEELSGSLHELDRITRILSEIRASLPATVGRPLLLVVEGKIPGACGWTAGRVVVIPIDNCNIRPLQDSVWPYGATYLLAHELTHLLGAVPDCAPHNDGTSHVDDDWRDVLYSGPGGPDWDNLMLDPGNDDYYKHGRRDCPDIADSPLLGSD